MALNITNRSRLNRTCSTATTGDDSRTRLADCSRSLRRAAPLRTLSATTRRLVGGLFRSVRSPNCPSAPRHSLETTPSAVLSTLLGPVTRHRQITQLSVSYTRCDNKVRRIILLIIMLASLGELTAAIKWLYTFHQFIWLLMFFCFEYIIALLQQLFAVVTIETDGDFE